MQTNYNISYYSRFWTKLTVNVHCGVGPFLICGHVCVSTQSNMQKATCGCLPHQLPREIPCNMEHTTTLAVQFTLEQATKAQRVSTGTTLFFFDDWLTVHHSITLVNFQLDAQNSYLFIYNTFIKILYMFRALPCSSSRGLHHNCIYAASGIVTLCMWLSCTPVKKPVHRTVTCREWRYQRLHIYNYNVDLLKMSTAMLETCTGF